MNDMKSIRFPPPVADEMVRAILEGRKTVTRRVVKPQPRMVYYDGILQDSGDDVREDVPELVSIAEDRNGVVEQIVPPYRPGDILYVRETWAWRKCYDCYACETPDFYKGHMGCFVYKTSRPDASVIWHPSIHMPREAARIFLRVTEVRVERLQEMTDDDFVCDFGVCRKAIQAVGRDALASPFWDDAIKPADRALYGWAANPWVWVIAFERCEKPEEV